MKRTENIFYGVVNNENSMTELLCNYMANKPFRDLFLSLFLPQDELVNFQYNDFDTQYTVELNNCRPDIRVSNDEYEILIEVKTSNSGLTDNQPNTYLRYLCDSKKEHTYLIFFVPISYIHQKDWSSKISEFNKQNEISNVQTKTIYWHELIQAIQKSELHLISEKINEFYSFLKLWFELKTIKFNNLEVSTMLNSEVPSIITKLFEIVNEVKNYCSKDFKATRISSNEIEYSVYFQDKENNYTLFFGIWYEFWKEQKSPLCYGIDVNWDSTNLKDFKSKHGTKLIEFENYVLVALPDTLFTRENCSEEISHLIYEELISLNKIGEE